MIQGCLELEEVIREQYDLIQEGLAKYPVTEGFFKEPETRCELIVVEWGNWHAAAFHNRPALYQQCTMRDAITTALTLDIFHRNAELVTMACVAQTVNVLNSLFLTDGNKCVRTPNFDVFLMYREHRGGQVLELEQTHRSEPGEVYVFASIKGKFIYVNLVNTNMNQFKEVEIDFGSEVAFLDAEVLEGDVPGAFNSSRQPDRIRSKKADTPERNGISYKMSIPAASVNLYKFQVLQ